MSSAGRFVWYELLTGDAAVAKAFYGAVLGWLAQPFEGGEPYSIWQVGEAGVGGVMPIAPEWAEQGMRPHWWAHVSVDDVDAAAARAEALGAGIRTPPTDIPGVGRFAVIGDPQGAELSLFRADESYSARPTLPSVTPGTFCWRELATTDAAAAWRFYSELFGWASQSTMDMGEAGTYRIFELPEDTDPDHTSGGGIYQAGSPTGGPAQWLYYMTVEDMGAALARVRAAGGAVLNGPNDVPGGQAAQCRDPEGAVFGVFALSSEAPPNA